MTNFVKHQQLSEMRLILVLSLLLFPMLMTGQAIDLSNPSFEDVPRHSLPPSLWIDCGFPDQTPADVQPSGAWGVFRAAIDGATYLGMTTRSNGTYEAIGQKLKVPIRRGKVYEVSLYLTTSAVYQSQVSPREVNLSKDEMSKLPIVNFDTPIVLQVIGSDGYCKQGELLFKSPPIDHHNWRQHTFVFSPQDDHTHLELRAHYSEDTMQPYNGNILVDGVSGIRELKTAVDYQMKIDSVEQEPWQDSASN